MGRRGWRTPSGRLAVKRSALGALSRAADFASGSAALSITMEQSESGAKEPVAEEQVAGESLAMEPMLPKGTDASANVVANGRPAPPAPRRARQYLAALAAAMGAMSAGAALGWSSSALREAPLTDAEKGWVGSLLALGALAGAPMGGSAADRWGRRPALIACGVPFVAGWALVALAKGPWLLYIARLLCGLATGALSVVAPVYIGEVADPEVRGALGSGFQLLLTVGILYAYVCGALAGFRLFAVLCALPPVALILCVFAAAPETPAFLVRRGDESGARAAMRRLRGVADEAAVAQLRADAAAGAARGGERRGPAAAVLEGVRSLVATRARRRAFAIALGLMFFQQFSGINAVIFYSQDIFDDAGSTLAPDAAACVVGVLQVAATATAAGLADRAGRRPLLLLSAAIMTACLLALGGCYYAPGRAPGWLPVIAVGLFLVVFSLGFGPLPWAMLGELFAPEVKGEAGGVAAAVNWLSVFVVTLAFAPAATAVGGAAVFWTFAAVCAAGVVFVALAVPETKGRSLAEIQRRLGGEAAPEAGDDAASV